MLKSNSRFIGLILLLMIFGCSTTSYQNYNCDQLRQLTMEDRYLPSPNMRLAKMFSPPTQSWRGRNRQNAGFAQSFLGAYFTGRDIRQQTARQTAMVAKCRQGVNDVEWMEFFQNTD